MEPADVADGVPAAVICKRGHGAVRRMIPCAVPASALSQPATRHGANTQFQPDTLHVHFSR
jgi:hypothetical protein